MKKDLTYITWLAMKQRCIRHPNYAGRGIKVCDRWLHSFDNFIADMGARPAQDFFLDRINNEGNYEGSNCRWATRKQQNRNTRQNKLLCYRGEIRCLSEWCETFNLNYARTYARIFKLGWSTEDAFNVGKYG